MGQVEQQPHPAVPKDARAHHAQNEGGAGVVAEGEQPFRLRFGAQALLVELKGGPGAYRIAADEAQGHRRRAGAAHPEQGPHQPFQGPAQIGRQPQVHHQGGQHEKGEQRRHNDVEAERQPVLGPGDGLAGHGHQTRRGQKQRQPRQRVPHRLFLQQPQHAITPVGRDYAAGRRRLPVPKNFLRRRWKTSGSTGP